jgi:hypothetical protein
MIFVMILSRLGWRRIGQADSAGDPTPILSTFEIAVICHT